MAALDYYVIEKFLALLNGLQSLVTELRDGQRETNDLLTQVLKGNTSEMATLNDLTAGITALAASVKANADAEQSTITLLQGLSGQVKTLTQELADPIAANDPAAIQAALTALQNQTTALDQNTSQLAAAVVANTPAAPAIPTS
jgi:hypothetical protein